MNSEEFLPQTLTVEVAFSAMAHFLAMHFNEGSAGKDVRDFLRTISRDELGRPATTEVFALFKEAVVRADPLEMVGLRETPS
jgi:hypothetical protein